MLCAFSYSFAYTTPSWDSHKTERHIKCGSLICRVSCVRFSHRFWLIFRSTRERKKERKKQHPAERQKIEKILLKQYQFILYFYPACVYECVRESDRYRRTGTQSHTDTNTISFSFCLMYTCFIITRLWYFFQC